MVSSFLDNKLRVIRSHLIPIDEGTCVNKKTDCISWAREGECHKNPKFMMKNCRRSCSGCGKSKSLCFRLCGIAIVWKMNILEVPDYFKIYPSFRTIPINAPSLVLLIKQSMYTDSSS